ncbi:MAG: ATP-binding protein, partial [Solirubrobacteraceae bacterium]
MASTTDWLVGAGDVVDIIRTKDWSATALGPIRRWPESLRTTVSLILASSFPINLIWGDGAVQIWNDGYAVVCGDKHPSELGSDYRVCWASAWPAIGGAFDRARGGETAYLTDQPMFLDRLGYLEETWFTFSLSPIFDHQGAVLGLFHPVTETTAHNLSQRRTRTLRELAERMSKARTTDGAVAAAREVLARSVRDLPLAALYLGRDPAALELAFCTGVRDGRALTGLAAGSASPVAVAAASGQRAEISDLREGLGEIEAGDFGEPLEALIVAPLSPAGIGELRCVLAVGLSTRLPHDELYMSHLDLVAQVISSGLSGAISYERERARAEQLAELDRAKTTFFSNISHEFRTPLTLILGPIEDLISDLRGSDPDRSRQLELVHRNGLRLQRMVNALLEFSRIESGHLEAAYVPTDLAAYTAEIAAMFQPVLARAELAFEVDAPPLAEPVWVDRSMWEKVVTNLLSNAFKHTFRGTICVRLRASPDGGAQLAVLDTGVGIAAAELPRVFERFHRVANARSRSIEGTGIGLALVRDLVTLHGGEVHVESDEGRGTTFTITLPGGYAHLPEEQLQQAAQTAGAPGFAAAQAQEALHWLAQSADSVGNGDELGAGARSANDRLGRIFVVDDNEDMRRHLVRILMPQFEVTAHADGQAALEAAAEHPPDLVLCDVMMPRLDGFGLLRALRQEPRTSTIPVIMLSARAGEESAVEGIAAGADDYLVKPFSTRELVARVSGALALSRLRRETEQRLADSNRELQAATKAKSEFLANMSHEIRTPMNAIVGMTSLLLDTPLSAEQSEFADVIRNAGDHLLSVINDVLDFSRIEAGLLDLKLEPFSVGGCVEESVELLAGAAAARGVELVAYVEPTVPGWIIGDEGRVRQVLVNLLGNAVKFTAKGEIALLVSAEPVAAGTRLTFAVRDTGVGIPPESIERLFEAFVQADSSITRARDGTGLGLPITRALTRL